MSDLSGIEKAEGQCAIYGWLLLVMIFASVANVVTKQLSGILATYDLFSDTNVDLGLQPRATVIN